MNALSACEKLPQGWANARVVFRHKDGRLEERIEIVHLETHNRFLHESMARTACKCLGIALFTFIYLTGYIVFHLIRIPLIACKKTEEIGNGIRTVARAFFYAIALEFAAIYGIFKPLVGREALGHIERNWHGKKLRDDLGFAELTLKSIFQGAFCDPEFPFTLFLAPCMQPRGKTTDPHVESVLSLGLKFSRRLISRCDSAIKIFFLSTSIR